MAGDMPFEGQGIIQPCFPEPYAGVSTKQNPIGQHGLFCIRHCAEHFSRSLRFEPHSHPTSHVFLLQIRTLKPFFG